MCGLVNGRIEIPTEMAMDPVLGVLDVRLCLIPNTKVDTKVSCILSAEVLEPSENLAIVALPEKLILEVAECLYGIAV